jgi:lysozyme
MIEISASLIATLKRDEGFRQFPYRDTENILTIGYGRNLEHVGISEPEAEQLLLNNIQTAIDTMPHRDVFDEMNQARQDVLINMCFNMGPNRLKGFRRMWIALSAGLWDSAANEMLDSKWSRQVGERSKRLAKVMRKGVQDESA